MSTPLPISSMKKQSLFLTPWAATALLLLGSMTLAQAAASPPANAGQADRIVFPQCQFHKASVAEALEFFSVKSRDLDPAKKGVNILAGEAVRDLPVKITMDCRDTPLSELFDYLAHMAGLEVGYDSDDVKIVLSPKTKPPYATGATTKRQQDQGAIVLPRMRFEKANLEESVEFVRRMTEKLAPGQPMLNILIDPALAADKRQVTTDLLQVTASDALAYIAAMADAEVVYVGSAFYFQPASQPQGKQLAAGTMPDLGSVGKTVLPQIQFSGATAAEAVTFLLAKSRDLDPQKVGARIFIDEEGRNAAGKITLDSRQVTLERALVQVASVAGLEIYQLPGAVRLGKAR